MELPRYITAGSSAFCQKSTLSLPVPPPPCQLTRSLSTKVTMLMKPTPTPSYQRAGVRVLFSHPCQHSASQIHRLMIPRLILLAGFQPKKKSISIPRADGWVPKTHCLTPLVTLCHGELYILDLHIWWLLICVVSKSQCSRSNKRTRWWAALQLW